MSRILGFILAMLPGVFLHGQVFLEKEHFRIVLSDREEGPLKLAVKALGNDLSALLQADPVVTDRPDRDSAEPEIVIVNRESGHMKVPGTHLRELDGFESHRVYVHPESNRIYLLGNDLRGTIFAIYTFTEEVLGVLPLKYWCSWKPERTAVIRIPPGLDIFYRSPQVRYRALLPGDQDFFNPWRELSEAHENIWLETALRLKINTVETYSTILPHHRLTDYAYLISRYGLVVTSHHTSGLNTSFRTWGDYWREMRGMEPPRYLLSNEQAILDFFRYNAETVQRSGIENLWSVAFRGEVDQPFWSIFEDAPEGDRERAGVINRMLQIQYDLIKEVTGEQEPYARITLYDELAILMAKGYLEPPAGKNMIWTFVAGRRDHYPYDDIVNFDPARPVKLGYYMNFGFASTGAHVAPAEGPWKMEFNYRYVHSKAPLYFSVVNVGNFREFVLELSANAKLLWDFDSYDSNRFLVDYCTRYFGEKHALEIAGLYKAFYDAYWIPKRSELNGLERQFIFQDLRYARVFDHVFRIFYDSYPHPDPDPLREIGYESIPGRTFRIDPEYNDADNQMDAMLNGLRKTIPAFESVAAACSGMMLRLDPGKQTFFNDNLRVYSYYMTHLSKSLYHYLFAYKNQADSALLFRHLDLALAEIERAQDYLFEAQHGIFASWYSDADPLTRTFQIDRLKGYLSTLKENAPLKQACTDHGTEAKKIVYVNSYHREFPPSSEITSGVLDNLPADSFEVITHFMDTKRNPTEAFIKKRAEELFDSIQAEQPDLMIVSDDNALKYLVLPHFRDNPMPVVFCGINWSVDQYDLSGFNITGILEVLPVREAVESLRPYYPSMKKMLVLNENTTTSRKTEPLLDTLLTGMGMEVDQELVDDFESWKTAFARASRQYDLIYLQTRGAIRDWDHDEALRHIDRHIRVPVVTCEDFMMPYAVFGVTQFSREQGEAAAAMAKSLLNGIRTRDIPVTRNQRTRTWLNTSLARKIGFVPHEELQAKATLVD